MHACLFELDSTIQERLKGRFAGPPPLFGEVRYAEPGAPPAGHWVGNTGPHQAMVFLTGYPVGEDEDGLYDEWCLVYVDKAKVAESLPYYTVTRAHRIDVLWVQRFAGRYQFRWVVVDRRRNTSRIVFERLFDNIEDALDEAKEQLEERMIDLDHVQVTPSVTWLTG